jgi:lipopolysaccharide export system permease protein
MVNARTYISANFSKSFLLTFLPFFLIISLVYLVRISSLTAKIKLTLPELLTLYSYSVPDIIFYTLPLSFIAALTNVLLRMSTDNELIALYALGLKANRVLKSLFTISLLFSILLLIISLFAMPTTKQLFKSFKQEKRSAAKLNIVPGKLGQKFGDYYIYIKEKRDERFYDLVIYNRTDKNHEQFFASKQGMLRQNPSQTSLLLKDGYGYTYADETLQQAKYRTLEAFDTSQKKQYHFKDTLSYWFKAKEDKKQLHLLLFYIFVSLIPMLSVYMIAAFSMINPRYQANHAFLIIFSSTLLLYLLASFLKKWGSLPLLGITIILMLGGGIWLFQKRVARYF